MSQWGIRSQASKYYREIRYEEGSTTNGFATMYPSSDALDWNI